MQGDVSLAQDATPPGQMLCLARKTHAHHTKDNQPVTSRAPIRDDPRRSAVGALYYLSAFPHRTIGSRLE